MVGVISTSDRIWNAEHFWPLSLLKCLIEWMDRKLHKNASFWVVNKRQRRKHSIEYNKTSLSMHWIKIYYLRIKKIGAVHVFIVINNFPMVNRIVRATTMKAESTYFTSFHRSTTWPRLEKERKNVQNRKLHKSKTLPLLLLYSINAKKKTQLDGMMINWFFMQNKCTKTDIKKTSRRGEKNEMELVELRTLLRCEAM